jgi:hypothetical protein
MPSNERFNRHRFRTQVVILLATCGLLIGSGSVRAQDVERHVALSLQLLDVAVAEWRERLALPPRTEPAARAAAVAELEKRYKAIRQQVFQQFGTAQSDHLAFFGRHARDVEAYFDEHFEIKERAETLTQELRSLIAQDEAQAKPPGGQP